MTMFLKSTIGRKYIMALTGLIWAGFVLVHMAGNFLLFVSADAYNAYSHALTSGKIIYLAEAVLVLSLIPHVVTAITLTLKNKSARDRGYATSASEKGASFASKTMPVQGMLILLFIVLHLIGFKYGTYYETTVDGVVMRDIFKLVVETFKNPLMTAWYLVALVVLGLHLSHGISSVFQSLGLLSRANQKVIKTIALAYAVLVAGGFLVQPIYIFLFAK